MKNRKIEYIFLILIGLITVFLISNLSIKLNYYGLGFNFDWLKEASGFAIGETAFNYSPSDSNISAILIGWINTLKIVFFSIFLANIIGIIIGVFSISSNPLLKAISKIYVLIIRQTPLLIQILFWYFVGFLNITETYKFEIFKSSLIFSNKGI